MSLRKFVLAGMFLAIGFLLRNIAPPMFFGMKPDLSLVMLFVIIIMMYDDAKIVFAAGMAAGIIAALTTNFPGGQIPNVIDKVVTTTAVYFLVKGIKPRLNNTFAATIIGGIATLISGSVFLLSALLLFGLPATFKVLFLTVVLPTAAVNAPITGIVFSLVTLSKRAVGYSYQK